MVVTAALMRAEGLAVPAGTWSGRRRGATRTTRMRSCAMLFRGGDTSAEPQLHIAGRLFPALKNTLLTSERCGMALTNVVDAAAVSDLVVIGVLGLGITPLLKSIRSVVRKSVLGTRLGEWDESYTSLLARGGRQGRTPPG